MKAKTPKTTAQLEAQLREQQGLHEEAEAKLAELECRRVLDFIAAGGTAEQHAKQLAEQRELVGIRERAVEEAHSDLQVAQQLAVEAQSQGEADKARRLFSEADEAAREVERHSVELLQAIDRLIEARRKGSACVVSAVGESVGHPHFRALGFEDAWRLADFRAEAQDLANAVRGVGSMGRSVQTFSQRAAGLHRRAMALIAPAPEKVAA